MALVSKISGTNLVPLEPFIGVDNATSGRLLKAITAFELARLRDGDMVYVQSVRDYWKWTATSTAVDDSTGAAAQLRYCNPTVNGANPGRFERMFLCSPDWLLQDFWIDTGAAGHNENSGLIGAPLNNDAELYQRWGMNAKISTVRTVTYLQAPVGETNLDFAIYVGGSLTFIGTPTINKTGVTLTAVATQVRTVGAEIPWAITGLTLGAADVGKIAIITQSVNPASVGAYAMILKDNGAGSVRVSPFGTFTPVAPFTFITPVIGDIINVITPPVLKVGRIRMRIDTQILVQAAPARQCCIFDSLIPDGSSSTFTGIIDASGLVYFVRSIVQTMSFVNSTPSTSFPSFCGGGVIGVSIRRGINVLLRGCGLTGGGITGQNGAFIALLGDCYFQNAGLTVSQGVHVNSQGSAFWDRASADSCILIAVGGFFAQSGGVPDWGTANAGHGIKLQSNSTYSYTTKPTINSGLGAGREVLIGGTDKLYSAIPYIEGANDAAIVQTV